MRPRVWVAIALYSVVMAGVSFAAHKIVGTFGWMGGLVTILAMYGAAVLYERRRTRPEILPPL